MKDLFDYIYYRWYCIYKKHDNNPELYSSGMVSAYQLLTIVNLALIIKVLFSIELPQNRYVLLIGIGVFAINYFKYERDFDVSLLEEKWGNESLDKKRLRMICLLIYLIVTFLVPWIYGISTN